MNTQMERHTAHDQQDLHHHHNAALHSGGHDENEHHGEKKSVLKKVKAKAKKIKNTLTGHSGHEDEHDRGHDAHDDHDDDDGYEEDDEEMETDPGVHGAVYSSQSTDPTAQGYIPGTRLPISAPVIPAGQQKFDPTTAGYIPEQEEILGHSRTDTGRPLGSEDQSFASSNMPVAAHSGVSHGVGLVDSRKPVGSEEGHYASKPVDVFGSGTHGASPLGTGTHASETHGAGALGTGIHSAGTHGASHLGTGAHTGGIHGASPLGTGQLGSGRAVGSEEQPLAPKNTPVDVHAGGRTHAAGALGGRAGATYDAGGLGSHAGETLAGAHGTEQLGATGPIGGGRSSGVHGAGVLGSGPQGVSGGGLLNRPLDMEKDPNAPKDEWEARDPGNYQTKVSDPTGMGAEEKGVNPIMHKLDKMNIHDEPHQPHLTREPHIGQEETMYTPPSSGYGLTHSTDEKFTTGSHDQFSPEPITPETCTFLENPEYETVQSLDDNTEQENQNQGSYTEKVSAAASMVADKAKQATSAVTSKLGYGGASDDRSHTAPTGQHHDTQMSEEESKGTPISAVTAVIADKASYAKVMMASKLGYGGTNQEGEQEHTIRNEEVLPESGGPIHEGPSKASAVGEYGKKMATTVYDKVAGVGSTVASKVPGLGTTTEQHEAGATNVPADKGVSMKEYIAEKLKPGEEDKALSKAITDALPLRKQNEGPTTEGGEEGKKVPIKGRVTESEEVRRRLGPYDETSEENTGSGPASPGKAVLDRIKDAATSWFGKGGETQPLSKGFQDNEDTAVGEETVRATEEQVKQPQLQ